jgi:hypothetical protein
VICIADKGSNSMNAAASTMPTVDRYAGWFVFIALSGFER